MSQWNATCGLCMRQRSSIEEILEIVLDTPVPSVREDQLLLVKRPRLEPAHVSISDEVVRDFRPFNGNRRSRTIHCLLKHLRLQERTRGTFQHGDSPPYTMPCFTRASLPAFAFSSSIQSGWNQSSCGIKPNETFDFVTAVTCLPIRHTTNQSRPCGEKKKTEIKLTV